MYIWMLNLESNVDGDISFNAIPCATKEVAMELLKQEKELILRESYHYSNLTDEDKAEMDIIDEPDEFYIFDPCDSYYENYTIYRAKLVEDVKYTDNFKNGIEKEMKDAQNKVRQADSLLGDASTKTTELIAKMLNGTDKQNPIEICVPIGFEDAVGMSDSEKPQVVKVWESNNPEEEGFCFMLDESDNVFCADYYGLSAKDLVEIGDAVFKELCKK